MRRGIPEYDPKNLAECVVSAGGPTQEQTRAAIDRNIETTKRRLAESGEEFAPPVLAQDDSVMRKNRLRRALRK